LKEEGIMAEFDNKLKVTISRTVEGKGEVFKEYESAGAIIFAHDGKRMFGTAAGNWSIEGVAAMFNSLRGLLGSKMFNAALVSSAADEMLEKLAKAAEDAEPEDDGENAETEES
jgi:hypothetical protein